MAAPGWPKAVAVPETTIVHIDADSSHHGSHHSSHHGSRHGPRHESQHGPTGYIQDLQNSRGSNRAATAAKLERRTSRRLDNSGTNDYAQEYAGDYPTEADSQAQIDAKTKTHNYDPKLIVVTYFKKWAGGVDDVSTLLTKASNSKGIILRTYPRAESDCCSHYYLLACRHCQCLPSMT